MLQAGDPAPGFRLPDAGGDGGAYTVEATPGHPVLVVFVRHFG